MNSSARNGADSARLCVTAFGDSESKWPDCVTDGTWSDFAEELTKNGHARTRAKESAGLFGMFKLKDGLSRKAANVHEIFGWALDLDKATPEQIGETFSRLDAAGLAYLVYSTHSHTDAKWKLRVLGPLSAPVAAKDWTPVWRAIIDKFSARTSDESCKDVCRMYYWPSCPPGGAEPIFDVREGNALDVSSLELKKPAAPAGDIDLNAPEILDGGRKIDRCPRNRSVFEHAEHLVRTMPPAISGADGHNTTLRLARALVWGLRLDYDQAKSLLEKYNERCEPEWSESELEHKLEAASSDDGAPYAVGALCPPPADSFDHLPALIQSGGRFWLRDNNSGDYSRCCTSKDDLLVAINTHYSGHEMHGGDEMPKWQHVQLFSRPILEMASCYFVSTNSYDPGDERFVMGLRIDPTLKAKNDPDVAAFLAAFAGPRLDDLQKWIAGCRSDLLSAPARALALVGPKQLGKSLFGHALARIWKTAPVDASVLCARFNGSLSQCPIVLADERMPKDLTGEAFRSEIQARRHSIEPKGKERQSLEGCIRFVVTANGIEKLKLAGAKGRDDVDAIADRFVVIQVPDARVDAIKRLQKPLNTPDGGVDLRRMAEHFLYLQATVEVERGRFIGAGSDAHAYAVTLAGETEDVPELFDLIREFFNSKGSWAAGYRLGEISGIIPKRGDVAPEARSNFPIIVQDGRVFVRTPVLGKMIGRELAEVRKTLKPFVIDGVSSVMVAGAQLSVHELDAGALVSIPGVDPGAMADALEADSESRILKKAGHG